MYSSEVNVKKLSTNSYTKYLCFHTLLISQTTLKTSGVNFPLVFVFSMMPAPPKPKPHADPFEHVPEMFLGDKTVVHETTARGPRNLQSYFASHCISSPPHFTKSSIM